LTLTLTKPVCQGLGGNDVKLPKSMVSTILGRIWNKKPQSAVGAEAVLALDLKLNDETLAPDSNHSLTLDLDITKYISYYID